MNPDKAATDRFLKDSQMHPDFVEIGATADHMLEEMTSGLNGEASSLAMIPTYIEIDTALPFNQRVVVLDAGGTNLRAALVSFSPDGRHHIEDFSKHPMPGTQGRDVGRTEFFDVMAALVEPLIDRGTKIGFCFSYPTEIFPDRDGRLIYWSKEVRAPEVAGCRIGKGLRDALSARGATSIPEVVILNDTVATALTGKVAKTGRDWGGFTGFILGTGSNTSYVESNSKIGKLSGLNPGHSQIINCETGTFRVRNRGLADEQFCALTGDPEAGWLEKMVSGAYFGPLATQLVHLAGEKGLLSSGAYKAVRSLGEISTKDADNYTHNPSDIQNPLVAAMKKHGSSSDGMRVWFLIDALLERAAKLTAANLASSVLKGPCGTGPLEPVCLSIDGTTYYRYYRFQHRVESWLRPFLSSRDKYYEMVQVEDAPLIGAAVAALTN